MHFVWVECITRAPGFASVICIQTLRNIYSDIYCWCFRQQDWFKILFLTLVTYLPSTSSFITTEGGCWVVLSRLLSNLGLAFKACHNHHKILMENISILIKFNHMAKIKGNNTYLMSWSPCFSKKYLMIIMLSYNDDYHHTKQKTKNVLYKYEFSNLCSTSELPQPPWWNQQSWSVAPWRAFLPKKKIKPWRAFS